MAASWWLIVLSWNGREDTLACLRSLRELRGADTEVVVRRQRLDRRLGRGGPRRAPRGPRGRERPQPGLRGRQQRRPALRASSTAPQWVVLVNNDAVLAPDAIDRLRAAAAEHPAAGMLAGKVFFDEPPDRIWFAGQRFWPALGYSGRPRGYGRRDGPRYRRAYRTDRAAGAFMAASRRVVDAVGLLDDDLFAYVEDVDWSLPRAGGRLRGLVRPRRARLAPRVGLDRRRARLDPRPLLRGAQHDRGLRAPSAAAAAAARAAPLVHPGRLPLPGVRPLRAPAPVRRRRARRLPRRARGALRRAPARSSNSA